MGHNGHLTAIDENVQCSQKVTSCQDKQSMAPPLGNWKAFINQQLIVQIMSMWADSWKHVVDDKIRSVERATWTDTSLLVLFSSSSHNVRPIFSRRMSDWNGNSAGTRHRARLLPHRTLPGTASRSFDKMSHCFVRASMLGQNYHLGWLGLH